MVCHKAQQGMGCILASPLQPWLREHCHRLCGAPDKCVSIIPLVLSAGKCPYLEMLRRGECSLRRCLTAMTLMEMPPDNLA